MWKKFLGWFLFVWAVSNIVGLVLFWDVPPGPGMNPFTIGITFALFYGWYRLALKK